MSHSDGIARNYNELVTREGKRTPAEKRVLSAIRRAEGISVNMFDGVLMDETFLKYAINEFERYVQEMETVVQNFHKTRAASHVSHSTRGSY